MPVFKYISSKEVIGKVFRDLNLQDTARVVDFVEWIGEALEYIGCFDQWVVDVKKLTIKDHRVAIPCNFYQLISIWYQGEPLKLSSSSFPNNLICCDLTTDDLDPLTLAKVDGLVTFEASGSADCSEESYTINPGYINTSFCDGEICIAYTAIPVDEDNYPMLPDDVSFKDALVKYIVMKLKYADWVSGRISANDYVVFTRDWEFSCTQARATGIMPSLDRMENIKNIWLRLVPAVNSHAEFFKNISTGESLNM